MWVAETFLPNPDDKNRIIHKDHNKLNNHVENLEWATIKEQRRHKMKRGLELLADSRVVYEIDTRTGKLVIWKSPQDFSMYEASNTTGKIRNRLTKKSMSLTSDNSGYIRIKIINDNGKSKTQSLHRLVAMTFLSNPNNKPTVNHKDHNKLNNNVENLEWATSVEQNRHKKKCNPEQRQLAGSRAVWRIDPITGKKLQRYETIKFAGKWLIDNEDVKSKRPETAISKICGETARKTGYISKTAYGFKWEYDTNAETKYENEVWKPIPPNLVDGSERYQMSDMGRVKNRTGRIADGWIAVNGYRKVSVGSHPYSLHRLMVQVFLPNIYNKPHVNHKDGDKTNAKLYNLEWCTRSENAIHALDAGLNNCRIPVIQYDLQMNELNRYKSVTEASKCLYICYTSISRCCLGKQKTAGGFIFRRTL